MSLPVPAMALLGPSEINELVLGVDHLVGRVFSSKGASIIRSTYSRVVLER